MALKTSSKINLISTFWWFRGFVWMESNVKSGKLPNEFNWPFQFLKVLMRNRISWFKTTSRLRKNNRRKGLKAGGK